MPKSNSPVTNVAGADVVCNAGGRAGVSGKCAIKAGGTVTIEMHQVWEITEWDYLPLTLANVFC